MTNLTESKTGLPSGFEALRDLHGANATGMLVLRAARFDDIDVYFMDGQVIACSGLGDEWLMGRLLIASGTVSADDMQRAMGREDHESMIDFLMQNELLSMNSLQGIQADRFRDNVHFACTAPWSDASFSKQDAVFPPDMQLGIDTPGLLDEIAEWYERVQPLLVMQRRGQDPVFARVPKSRLGKGELKIVTKLVKQPIPLSTALALSPLPRYRTLASLAQLVAKRVLSVSIAGEDDLEKASLTGELEVLSASLETSEEAILLSTMEIEPLVAEAQGLSGLASDSGVTGPPDPEGLQPENDEEEAFFADDIDEDAIGEVSSADIEAAGEARLAREAEEDARIAALTQQDAPAEDAAGDGEAEEIEELDEASIAVVEDSDIAGDDEEGDAGAGEAGEPDATDVVEPGKPPADAPVEDPPDAGLAPEDVAGDGEERQIDYEKGNVKVYDVLDKVDLSDIGEIPGVNGDDVPVVVEEFDGDAIAAVENSIELGEGSEDLEEGMVDTDMDPELLAPESKVSEPGDAPDPDSVAGMDDGGLGSSADLFDSSADLHASGEVPPIHLSGTDDSVEFFIDEDEDGLAVVRISESSIAAINASDRTRLDLPGDIPFNEGQLTAFLQRIEVFNRIFRVIYESFAERLGTEATLARFDRFLGDKSLQYPALFEEMKTSEDGTLAPASLIMNVAKAQPQDHDYFLHEGLYDLIYIHLYDAKDVLSPDGERGMMDQIVAYEEQLHRP